MTKKKRPQEPDQTNIDTQSTDSTNSEEVVATHEPAAYPAIPVQDYRDGPIEEIAVQYVNMNSVVEMKATRNRQQQDIIRAAEQDIMLDRETLIKDKRKSHQPGSHLTLLLLFKDNNTSQTSNDQKYVAKKLTLR